jgi:sugar O-acyltransferase (sialic acid O-acetyltransferase NeuD family)
MKPVILFGTGYVARFVSFMLERESEHEVVALTVDGEHISERQVFGLPVVALEDMVEVYPPEDFSMFVALGYTRMNGLREQKAAEARTLGYELISHVSPRASTWDDLQMGDNCILMDQVIVHPFARFGNNSIVWSGAHIGHGSEIGNNCFIASRALIAGSVTVGDNCFIGANATISHRTRIGRASVIGAGAAITKDTEERSVYASPAPRRLPGTADKLPGL